MIKKELETNTDIIDGLQLLKKTDNNIARLKEYLDYLKNEIN